MRVAIIGGGAAGLVSAYLLAGRHQLSVFESSSVLGGHVRTLNGNVSCEGLDPRIILDAGVVEFDEHQFPTLGRLLDELKVERRSVPGTTALFLADGRRFQSPRNIELAGVPPIERLGADTRLLPLAVGQRRFERRAEAASRGQLYSRSISEYLGYGTHAKWLRMLLMYAYSISYPETADIPAALAVPVLRAFTGPVSWTAIQGGTYDYLERLTQTTEARFVLDARIASVTRPSRPPGPRGSQSGVEIRLENGEVLRFDAVVFATPPDQVLALLGDPTPAETRRFSSWRANHIHTVIHTDTTLYQRRGATYYSEFDLFEGPDGRAGYNAYLNRLAGLPPDHAKHYFLSYGMDHEIDPACVLHEQSHHTPLYTVAALSHREEVLANQGERHTYHAGAWLGDGLHEGALCSAVRISEALGGRRL